MSEALQKYHILGKLGKQLYRNFDNFVNGYAN